MATQFDVENLNPGTRFQYGDDEDTWVELRVCTGDDFRKIIKATTKKVAEVKVIGGRAHRITWDETKEQEQNEMIWDYCIINWGGFVDKQGDPIPCTFENKKLFMGGSVKFSAFIANKLEVLRKLEGDIGSEEEDEKN
jgi:hypothetical protein